VRLTYRGRTGSQTQRTVDPWGLVDKSGVWYLVAGTANGERTFRVDRIARLEETDLPGGPPGDFDLDAAWRAIVDEIEDVRGRVHATVVIGSQHLPVLRDHFGRHLTVLGPADEDGQVTVRVSAHMVRGLAEKLAGWGNLIDVLEPQVVRAELARIGAELTTRYGDAEWRRSRPGGK
jgi:predicted DNA-binding transcriptional regulator YafY